MDNIGWTATLSLAVTKNEKCLFAMKINDREILQSCNKRGIVTKCKYELLDAETQ